jgi:hypothetical protein
MTSKIVTDYLRDLAKRLELITAANIGIEDSDWLQLIDLANILDEERDRPPEPNIVIDVEGFK